MKMTQIMSKLLKGILLYSTIIYFFCFAMAIESLSVIALVIGLIIFVLLLIACYIALNDDNLENYVPKWFK
jgi:hypothetical protein